MLHRRNKKPLRDFMRWMYLYLTIPLVLITALLAMVALMAASPGARTPIFIAPDAQTIVESRMADTRQAPSVSANDGTSTVENAAIVTAVVAGLTGLMGAMAQILIAFLKKREELDDKRKDNP